MDGITADEFLSTVFPPDLLLPDERVVVAHPASFVSRETGETVDYFRQLNYRAGVLTPGLGWYFCVSTVRAQRSRQVKKRLEDARTAFVLVVDDVGTKSKQPPGALASYTLETSAGNFQYGYLIEPWDVSQPETAHFYDMCLVSLAAAGFNDPGFRSATRLARLPGSVHKSGFVARLETWGPDRVYTLPELMALFDVPMVAGRPRRARERAPGVLTSLIDVTDPLFHWLNVSGRLKSHNEDFVFMDCPWRAGHTDGKQGPTATGFSPRGYGRYWERGFKCLHGHCAGYGVREFEEWARGLGAEID